MPTHRTGAHRHIRRCDGAGRPDNGFALVWFAMVLVVFMSMAGAAVDLWNWWYNANQEQRTADAAALGGVVFLPQDPAAARATALDIAVANGAEPSEVTVETTADDPTLQTNELRVVVSRAVPTKFLHLIGVDDASITRDATAQYTTRLPMGSPEQVLGRDPEQGHDPGYWLSVSGRGETKVGGDRYQNHPCGPSYVFNCNGGTSTEYSPDGYAFSIELNGPPTGDLVIEAYDPVHTETGAQDCTDNGRLPDNGDGGYFTNLPAIQARYSAVDPSIAARYEPDDSPYCNGDIGGGNSTNDSTANVTTFIVREPDNTPAEDFDNPAIDVTTNTPDSGCTRQFRATDLAPNGTQRTIYQLLAGVEGDAIADSTQAVYRQWVSICTIPAGIVQGWYVAGHESVIVQVRSNADLGAPFIASSTNRSGRNHFALRAGYGTATAASDVSVYALGRLPIHNGAPGDSTTEFFLTRVPPGNAGRTLSLAFYDVADAGGEVDFEIVPPTGFGGSFDDCSFTRLEGNNDGTNEDVGLGPASATGCKLSGMTNASYDGRVTEVRVGVPETYTCDLADPDDCWLKVRVTYDTGGGTVFDHTVWDAGVVGEPVRLVE